MQYLDKLKKERSIDRVIFLAGMCLAFIGFIIPTVYVRDEVLSTDEAVVEEAEDSVAETSSYDFSETDEFSDSEDALDDDFDAEEEDDEFDYLNDTEDDDDFEFGEDVETKVFYKNIFGAASYFNRAPTAYNATFLVAIWLCVIAGIVLFFVTKSIIGDILATLIALAFGLASIVGIAPALTDEFGAYAGYYADSVTPFFGYTTVGGYFVAIGLIVAVVGSILGAAHVKQPDQTN